MHAAVRFRNRWRRILGRHGEQAVLADITFERGQELSRQSGIVFHNHVPSSGFASTRRTPTRPTKASRMACNLAGLPLAKGSRSRSRPGT
jgi:hypothetical protein